jgi:hypothetical protein
MINSYARYGLVSESAYIWTISAMLGALVISPLSGVFFQFNFGYSVEIPLALIAIVAVLLSTSFNLNFLKTFIIGFFGAALILFPFLLFAVLRSVPFNSYYPDFRAMLLLIITYVVLSSLEERKALLFVYRTNLVAVLVTAALFFGDYAGFAKGIVSHGFTGRYFPPVFSVMVLCLFLVRGERKFVPLFAITLLFLMSFTSLYRQLYVISTLLSLSGLYIVMFRGAGRLAPLVSALQLIAISIVFILLLQVQPEQIYSILVRVAAYGAAAGIDSEVLNQLLLKTAATLYGQTTSTGDGNYVNFLVNLFNITHFALPHGLGQSSSIGDPDIWGANTIDNSIIFFNYHFSAFIGMPLLFGFFIWLRWTARNCNIGTLIAIIPLLLSVAIFLYFRAWPFVSADAALAFSMLLYAGPVLARHSIKN